MRDVIEMARRAGAVFPLDGSYHTFERREDLEAFANLVRADQREACAKVCDAVAQRMDDEGEGPTGNMGWVIGCADAIRNRGNT